MKVLSSVSCVFAIGRKVTLIKDGVVLFRHLFK